MTLSQKIKKAKKVIREAGEKWPAKNIAIAWTGGKDSTTVLHLVRETFHGKIPFKVFFNDSTLEFPEVYDFVKKLKKEWQIDLIRQKHLPEDLEAYHQIIKNIQALEPSRLRRSEATGEPRRLNDQIGRTDFSKVLKPSKLSRDKFKKSTASLYPGKTDYKKAKPTEPRRLNEEAMEIMRIAKINAINYAINKYQIEAFISGIRHDEHQARSKEAYFSQRSTRTRVHPIIDFTLDDIWSYIKKFKIPYVDLYDKGYKSLGEAPFTKPVKDKNAPERAGREATKEKTMERLRKLGYW